MLGNRPSQSRLASGILSLVGMVSAVPSADAQSSQSSRPGFNVAGEPRNDRETKAALTLPQMTERLGEVAISDRTPSVIKELAGLLSATFAKNERGNRGTAAREFGELTHALEKQLVKLTEYAQYLENFRTPPEHSLSEDERTRLLEVGTRVYWGLLKRFSKEEISYNPEWALLDQVSVTKDFAIGSVDQLAECSDTPQKAFLRLIDHDLFEPATRDELGRKLLSFGTSQKAGKTAQQALMGTLGRLQVTDGELRKEIVQFLGRALSDPHTVYDALDAIRFDDAIGREVVPFVHEAMRGCNDVDLLPRFLAHLREFDCTSERTIERAESLLRATVESREQPQYKPTRTVAYQILRAAEKLPEPLPPELDQMAHEDLQLKVQFVRVLQQDNFSQALLLIRQGVDVRGVDLSKLAHNSAAGGRIEELKTLKRVGFDYSKAEHLLLRSAVRSGDLGVVEFLIAQGVRYADKSSEPGVAAIELGKRKIIDLFLDTYQGEPSQWGYMMAMALQEGDTESFEKILATKRVNMREQGWLMVHHAAGRGDAGLVRRLFHEMEAVDGNVSEHIGGAIGNAAQGGHLAVLKYFMERGIDLKQHLSFAAHQALRGCQKEVLRFLKTLGDIEHGCMSAIRIVQANEEVEDAETMVRLYEEVEGRKLGNR